MKHTPGRFKLWLISSMGYVLLTGAVIVYASFCEELFCHLIMVLPGLPWTLFFSPLLDGLSYEGWIILTVLFASFNVGIFYVLLSEDKEITESESEGAEPAAETDQQISWPGPNGP